MAIGASGRSVVALIVRQTAWPAAAGIVAGMAGVAFLQRVAESQLVGIDGRQPPVIAVAVLAVAVAVLLAAWFPARRAARIDPAVVLRAE